MTDTKELSEIERLLELHAIYRLKARRDHAVDQKDWAMEGNLFWKRNGEKQWLRGFGFYHESYVREADGQWRFSYRKLERTHAETSPGASLIAADFSGENLRVDSQ